MNPVSNIVWIGKLYIYYIQLNLIVSFTLFFLEKNIIYYITKEATVNRAKISIFIMKGQAKKMKKAFKHDVGRKIGSVTHMPTFMLGLQGWFDSRKGERLIPDARVEGMKNKCTALEKREALIIESRCEPVRKKGLRALSKIFSCKEYENSIHGKVDDTSPYAIRANARSRAKREEAKTILLEVKESLVHADIVLSERIRKTREKAFKVKIAAYIKGVRKGKIPDYNPNLDLVDDAYSIYIDKHKLSDEAIFNAVEKLTQEVI